MFPSLLAAVALLLGVRSYSRGLFLSSCADLSDLSHF